MRNKFGNSDDAFAEHESEFGGGVHPTSPDQIAIIPNKKGEAISAIPVRNYSEQGTYDMEVVRHPLDQQLVPSLKLLRESHLKLPEFTDETQFLTAVDDYSERTRVLALDGEVLALSDIELFEWLINAERQMILGTDNHPVFEMALEETACSITRLPNGQIAMTEASRDSINLARDRMRSLFGDAAISSLNLGIETSTRSAARYYLTAVPQGAAVASAGKESELTAFLLISRSGFSFGLWSSAKGLFSEYAFLAPVEVSRAGGKVAGAGSAAKLQVGENRQALTEYIRNAIDELALQLSPENLEELDMSRIPKVVWTAERELVESVESIVRDYQSNRGMSFTQMGVNVEEAIVGGLLFGSFTFGDENVIGAGILPQVNLARDLLMLADKEEIKRRQAGEMRMRKRRRQAVFTLLAGPVIVFAFLLAFIADHVTRQTYFAIREVRADARTVELKPALERRQAYEANLKWYQEFIKQVSRLRKQQPVGIGMLYQLNQNYPFDLDPSFFVQDLKLKSDAGIEITGLARNKDAVTSFLRSLEFAGGPESGTKLFSNLTYEVKEGVAQPAVPAGSNPNALTMSESTLGAAGPAPGVIAWTIRGNYLPMAAFVPPDPKKAPPAPAAAPPAAAPAAPAPGPAAPGAAPAIPPGPANVPPAAPAPAPNSP